MSFAINDSAITVADYVLEYARKLPRGDTFDADSLHSEDVADGATYSEYERAIGELLRDGKIVRRA